MGRERWQREGHRRGDVPAQALLGELPPEEEQPDPVRAAEGLFVSGGGGGGDEAAWVRTGARGGGGEAEGRARRRVRGGMSG